MLSIVCLQDTHRVKRDISKVKDIWGHECYIHGNQFNAEGVAILFNNNNSEYEVLSSVFDGDGNYCPTLKMTTMTIHIMTIYAPNTDNPTFFLKMQDILKEHPADYYIICGDFNLVLQLPK